MTGMYARAGVIVPGSVTRFEYVSRGSKVGCTVCGRRGYGETGRGGVWPAPWQRGCLRGHGACPGCRKVLLLRLDGTIRAGHSRCPGRPPDWPGLR